MIILIYFSDVVKCHVHPLESHIISNNESSSGKIIWHSGKQKQLFVDLSEHGIFLT